MFWFRGWPIPRAFQAAFLPPGGGAGSMWCCRGTFWMNLVRLLSRLSRITLSPTEIRDLADSFMFLADVVEPSVESEQALRDPTDRQILGTLRAARAEYLITGDKDLLVLADRYPILTPAAFWERHGG